MYRAKDGHLFKDLSEVFIDNWLAKRGIEHVTDVPFYPVDEGIGLTCNWLAERVYIDFEEDDTPTFLMKERIANSLGQSFYSIPRKFFKNYHDKNAILDNILHRFVSEKEKIRYK